jgi:hypothetical protein
MTKHRTYAVNLLRFFGSVAAAAAIGAGGAAVATATAHADETTCRGVPGSVMSGPVIECGDGGDGLDPSAEQGAGAHELHPKGSPPRGPAVVCPPGEILGANGNCFRPPPN